MLLTLLGLQDAPPARADGRAASAAEVPVDPAIAALNVALLHATDADQAQTIATRLEAARQSHVSPTARLLMTRGEREAGQGRLREAIGDLDDAVELQPDAAPIWRARAGVHALQGDADAATLDLGGALDRDPTDIQSWSALSSLEEHRGRLPAAFEAWEHVLRIDPMIGGGALRLVHLRHLMLGDPT